MPKPRGTITFDDKELLISDHSDNLVKKCDTNQKQLNIPESILKSSATTSSSSTVAASAAVNRPKVGRTSSILKNVKPNTIMSLEDRDIVIIDNIDYKESTCNEGTVIVLDKPRSHYQQQQQQQRDIDLVELLGSNWPALAGDSALALNNRATFNGTFSSESNSSNSSSNYQLSLGSTSTPVTVITERNRSKNPLNHLGQSKVKRAVNKNTNGYLINLDSDGSSAGTSEFTTSKFPLFRIQKKSSNRKIRNKSNTKELIRVSMEF